MVLSLPMGGAGQRRVAILAAAARLFDHYGHAKTTMADVAREAGVGVGTVYLEFESKEAILEELSLAVHAAVLGAMQRASEREKNHDHRFAATLLARTEAFLALRERGQHACELVHCRAEGVLAAHQRFRAEEHALLTKLLTEAGDRGTFRRLDAPATARLVQRAYASLSPPWIYTTNDDVLRTSEQMCELLVRGLCARPSETKASRPR